MTVQEGHESPYLHWLIRKNGLTRYSRLCSILFHSRFYSRIPMDDNRAGDGLYMRNAYISSHALNTDPLTYHLDGECSVLEFLIAFADRVEEAVSYTHDRRYWLSYFLTNMGLIDFDDRFFEDNPGRELDIESAVDERVHILLDRRYAPNGCNGGLFVMKDPNVDIRPMEYWWQMQHYVQERYMPRD